MSGIALSDLASDAAPRLNAGVCDLITRHTHLLDHDDMQRLRRHWASPKGRAVLAGRKVQASLRTARGYDDEPLACDELAGVVDPSYVWDWWKGEC